MIQQASGSRAGRWRNAARVLQTLRYLRLRQMFYQARARLPRRLVQQCTRLLPPLGVFPLHGTVERPESHLGGGRFRFLNETADLGEPIDWSAPKLPLLWQYNLHYFDFLQQPSASRDSGDQLIASWIANNPPAHGAVAWQPYPTSLRIVNWLKFAARFAGAAPLTIESLFLQTENLGRQIEYHLLGNHLFTNGKALWFAGVFLGRDDWKSLGKKIVLTELAEQFLSDGGHFELSPMYHAIALEDLLDLVNLADAAGDAEAANTLRDTAARALAWLVGIVPEDGELPLLNDAARGIAADVPELAAYAERVSVSAAPAPASRQFEGGWTGRSYSSYWVLTNGALRLLFDTAPLGPDYLPGHAHCDMLSLLLWVRGKPILTDTGTFEYAETPRRTYSRSTSAHNTVQIDDLEQGDIWKSFRLGKRGRPLNVTVADDRLSAEHTGFEIWRRGLRHRRTVRLHKSGFELIDRLEGPAAHKFAARFHFSPEVMVVPGDDGHFQIGTDLILHVSGGDAVLITTEFYPEFGIVEDRACLIVSASFQRKHELRVTCTFSS